MDFEVKYNADRFLERWEIYKKRKIFGRKCVATFNVGVPAQKWQIYNTDVLPYIELLKEQK